MSPFAVARDALAPPGTWAVDPARSRVRFSVNHIMVATVNGAFTDFGGTLDVGPGGVVSAAGVIRVASIDTGEPVRDARLRSPDFFDIARFPTITFVSSAIDRVPGAGYRAAGRLTIRGVTQDVALALRVRGSGDDGLGIELRGALSHRAFGIGAQALAAHRVILGHKVKVTATLWVVRAEAPREAA